MGRLPLGLLMVALFGCGTWTPDDNLETGAYVISATDHEDALSPGTGDLLFYLEITFTPESMTPDELVVTAGQPGEGTSVVTLEPTGEVLESGDIIACREAANDIFNIRSVGKTVIVGLSVTRPRGLQEVANTIWTPVN